MIYKLAPVQLEYKQEKLEDFKTKQGIKVLKAKLHYCKCKN